MSYNYDYYRNTYPGWGTTQLGFRGPPPPPFQPLSSWGGWDYYAAQAYNPDSRLYNSVIDRVRGLGHGGYDIHDAKAWQRRIYSGIVNLAGVRPDDIGAAAAYEAYRMWKHHRGTLFAPLGGMSGREREALVGLAVGEASRLWAYSGRPLDTYGQRDCLESAAQTASNIAYSSLDGADRDYAYEGHRRHSSYEDPYEYERGRRLSNVGQPGAYAAPYTQYPAAPGYPGSSSSHSSELSSSLRRRSRSPYMVQPPMPAPGGSPYLGGVPQYASSAPAYATQQYNVPNYGTPYTATQPMYGQAPSYGQPYGQAQPYGQTQVYSSNGGMTTIPAQPGSTIIIKGRSRRGSSSGHHHHSRDIRRSRSAEFGYDDRSRYD